MAHASPCLTSLVNASQRESDHERLGSPWPDGCPTSGMVWEVHGFTAGDWAWSNLALTLSRGSSGSAACMPSAGSAFPAGDGPLGLSSSGELGDPGCALLFRLPAGAIPHRVTQRNQSPCLWRKRNSGGTCRASRMARRRQASSPADRARMCRVVAVLGSAGPARSPRQPSPAGSVRAHRCRGYAHRRSGGPDSAGAEGPVRLST